MGLLTVSFESCTSAENGYVESFNGTLRDELLDREIFYTLTEAQILIERWRRQHNTVRPHSALGYRPPAPEAVVPTPIGRLIMSDVSPENDDRLELQYGGALGVPRTERMGPMKRSKFSEEQVAYALRQAESGTAVGDVCRQVGISEATFYVWKKKYAHLGVSELRRLRQIEEENTRLKRLVADLSLDKHMLSEALRKKV